MKTRVCVVMPTYNERENLEPTLGDLFARNPGVDVLIVDDNSPDGTGELADVISSVTCAAPSVGVVEPRAVPEGDDSVARNGWKVARRSEKTSDASVPTADLAIANRLNSCTNGSQLHVLHRAGKLGLGSAYVDGFNWALERGYGLICEMDMDGSHRPEDLARLLEYMDAHDDVDLVLGSRRVAGGTTEDWPWYRDFISRAGSAYARFMLGLKVRDMTSGFRVYRAPMLQRVALDTIEDNGYVFQIDMTRRVVVAGGRVAEVPIVFPERVRGASKMDSGIVREAMTRVTRWGFARIFSRK